MVSFQNCRRALSVVCFAVFSSLLSTSAWAEADTEKLGSPVSLLPPAFFGGTLPLADERLDNLRGGFRFASGLEVHFGLEFRTQFDNNTPPVVTTFT